ncbi:MAG: XdhC/CoxI family protein [Anaerolineae bacterium]|nr:XdhC/CoxI family protein [Anaerolineae bacterium]MCX8067059.1 XdhC/CoxI family protein [Anaerolineae bacterium]MDW7992136.1 XdhC/CoxI family protein [Anaerolineae bacterium]
MYEELERVYEAILEALRAGTPAAVATVVEVAGSAPRQAGAKMLIRADGTTVGTVGGGGVEARVIEEAKAAIAEGRSRELLYRLRDPERGDPGVCGGDMRILIEVLPLRPTLLILGAGHVGQAVAELGAFLGYRIVVMDERPGLAAPERFPWAETCITGKLAEEVARFPIGPQTYVVMVTPHYEGDAEVLAALTNHTPAYVGLIGSRRRTALTFQRARDLGVPEDWLAKVHTPIGLDIGAETPREIAVSILAEIIAVQRGKA